MEQLLKIVETQGLGVALACAMGVVCWVLLKYIINSHKEDREAWQKLMEEQRSIITNHLSHLTSSSNELAKAMEKHDLNSINNSQRIIEAIDNQTDVIRMMLEKVGGNNAG
ncbi:MAG: hypothetical protein DRP85_00730 [Candidatus Makaraimicrobium thalassicum]|nr:MAG: hypothetical protein DRP85_00730 [Candidatus Omnitrophota bacterium]